MFHIESGSLGPVFASLSGGVFDVVVIGAGAAGIGAARRLINEEASFIVLEAHSHAGGRAHTLTERSGAAIDLGCGWLHSADHNSWVGIAEAAGFQIDHSRPPWERRVTGLNLSATEAQAFGAAFQAFEAKLDAAAAEPDRPAADFFDEATSRWRPMLDAFSSYYNGALLRDISVHDYAAYQPTDENWRVVQGYGALITHTAAKLPIIYNAAVTRIDHTAAPVRLTTVNGEIQARHVIVTAPTTVLA